MKNDAPQIFQRLLVFFIGGHFVLGKIFFFNIFFHVPFPNTYFYVHNKVFYVKIQTI